MSAHTRRSRRLADDPASKITYEAYLEQLRALDATNSPWGVMEIDQQVEYEPDPEHFLYGSCYFWGFTNEVEASVFAALGNAIYQAHAGKKQSLLRMLVAFPLPPCEVAVCGKTWYVPADFPLQQQPQRLSELQTLFQSYYIPRTTKSGALSAEELKENREVFYALATKIVAASDALPRSMLIEVGDGFLSDDPERVMEVVNDDGDDAEEEDEDASMEDVEESEEEEEDEDEDEDEDDESEDEGDESDSNDDDEDDDDDDDDDEEGSDEEEEDDEGSSDDMDESD